MKLTSDKATGSETVMGSVIDCMGLGLRGSELKGSVRTVDIEGFGVERTSYRV